APVVYQDVGGTRTPVAAAYVLRGDGTVSLALGSYEVGRALVIDPVLSYSTYLGGDTVEVGHGIAVDSAGNAYAAGFTESSDFPTVNALQGTNHGAGDAFVAKLNAAGTALVYATYLGGSGGSGVDEAFGIAVDGAGNAYVTGFTSSTDFPTVNPFQAAYAG